MPRALRLSRPRSSTHAAPTAVAALLATASLVVAPSLAHATDCSAYANACVDSDVLWATGGHSTFFSIPSAITIAPGAFGFGLASSVQHDPIVFRTSPFGPAGSTNISAISTQVVSTFLFSYGLTDRLQLDVAAPLTFYQNGTGTSRVAGTTDVNVSTNGMRDVRLGAEYAIVSFARARAPRGIGVLARFDVSLPTGDQDNFGGDRGLVAIPTIAVEERLSRFTFGAALGARIRETATLLAGSPGALNVGSQASLSLGAAVDLDDKRTWSVTAEAFLLAALTSNAASPIQGLAGLRWAPLWAGDFTMHAGFGGGFRSGTNAQVTEPNWRGTFDVRFAPIARDTDGDGILDRLDICPDEPEDKDGFEDSDGCPDPDNDKDGIRDKLDKCPDVAAGEHGIDGCPDPDRDADGIPDRLDKCPDKPEDMNGYEDTDGCPEGGPPKLPQTRCADGSLSAPGGTCDSDKDGLTDDVDVCPLEAEDFDRIVDDDGCPEADADEDGVADTVDKCPLEAETIDGKSDDDGCPEPGAHDHVVFAAGAIEIPLADKPISFATGSAAVSAAMTAQVKMIAQRAQGLVDRGVKEIVVEGWGDRAGDSPQIRALAQKRADAMKAALVAAGIPAGLVTARVGDLVEARKKGEPSYLVTVRTKRKRALGLGKAKAPESPR